MSIPALTTVNSRPPKPLHLESGLLENFHKLVTHLSNSKIRKRLTVLGADDRGTESLKAEVRTITRALGNTTAPCHIDTLARMVDPALEDVYPAKSPSRLADIVALCVQPEPEFRPSMSEVVQSLVRLMQRATLTNRQTESKSSTFQADTANE